MPRRSSKKPKAADENEVAARIVGHIISEHDPEAPKPPAPEKNPAAVALGRLGGKKGGRARAESLSPERRAEIARKAAAKRWKKNGGR